MRGTALLPSLAGSGHPTPSGIEPRVIENAWSVIRVSKRIPLLPTLPNAPPEGWKLDGLSSGTVTRNCMVRVVPLRAETRVPYMHMRSPSESVPTRRPMGHAVWSGYRLHRGSGKRVRAAHCSSRGVGFQWTKVVGVEITGLETRWFEQWHRHSELPGQSRATACGDACPIHAYAIAKRNRANSTPYGARSVKRQPALHRGSGKRVRAAHCSSRGVGF